MSKTKRNRLARRKANHAERVARAVERAAKEQERFELEELHARAERTDNAMGDAIARALGRKLEVA